MKVDDHYVVMIKPGNNDVKANEERANIDKDF